MKYFSRTLIISILLYLSSIAVFGESIHQDIKLVARIKTIQQKIQIIQNGKKAPISGILRDKKLLKSMAQMKAGDEALIEGHIVYEKKADSENHRQNLTPVFVIDSIRPISLKDLGASNAIIHDQELHITPENHQNPRGIIEVTPEFASAITLTASLLMLDNLTAKNQVSSLDNNMSTGVIVSAGALAAGIFVYEQLKKNAKK